MWASITNCGANCKGAMERVEASSTPTGVRLAWLAVSSSGGPMGLMSLMSPMGLMGQMSPMQLIVFVINTVLVESNRTDESNGSNGSDESNGSKWSVGSNESDGSDERSDVPTLWRGRACLSP